MPSVFKQTGSSWSVEVPHQQPGPCELEIVDVQTSEAFGRFGGVSTDGVAKFEVSFLPLGRTVRLNIWCGAKSITGVCRVPGTLRPHRYAEKAAVLDCRREEEVTLPLSRIREAMPGVLMGEIESKVGTGLSVGEKSPLFSAVAERLPHVLSCTLVGVSEDGFRFRCEVP